MLTTKDFIAKYKTYSDEELYVIYTNAANYSAEANEALYIVIDKKDGLQALIKRLEAKAVIDNEKLRIASEATKLGLGGVDASFIKNTTSSTILSKEEVNEIIEKNAVKAALQVEDNKVNAETIFKSIVGCGLASIVGGAFASIQFVYFGATSILLIIGTALICYSIVKLLTKKSYNNSAVLLSSFVAFIISYFLGQLALLIFGYLG
jgi:hypothetical protein